MQKLFVLSPHTKLKQQHKVHSRKDLIKSQQSQEDSDTKLSHHQSLKINRTLFANSEYVNKTQSTQKQYYQSSLIKHQHTRTAQLLDRSIESFNSDDSENDLFREHKRIKQSSVVQMKSRSKILNQIAYITQKMTPEYQRGMQMLDKLEQALLSQQEQESLIMPVQSSLLFGEVPIYYSFEKHPIELLPDNWNCQEIRQMEFYYYKIRAKSQFAPMQFFLKQNVSNNFKIFVSAVNPFPTKFSCDQLYTIKGWKYKPVDDTKVFANDYIYLSFVSDQDVYVKMKFQFEKTIIRKATSLNRPYRKLDQSQELIGMTPDMLKTEIAEIKKRRRQKLQQMHGGNIRDVIKENIQNVKICNEGFQRSQREQRKVQYKSQIDDVLERKRVIEEQEHNKREYEQTAKELTKTIRQQQLIEEMKRNAKNRVSQNWLTLIYLGTLGECIHRSFLHKVEMIKNSRLMAFQVKRIMKKISQNLEKTKGVTIFDRAILDTKFILQIFAAQIYKKQVIYLTNKSIPMLRARASLYHLKSQMALAYTKRLKIKQKFTEFLSRYRNYKQLVNSIWQKYYRDEFQTHFNSLSADKEAIYQTWFQNIQNNQQFEELVQKTFVNLYSKSKLKTFLRAVNKYSTILRQFKPGRPTLKRQLTSKFQSTESKQATLEDVRDLKKPRLFVVPGASDVLEMLPKVFQETHLLAEQILNPKKHKQNSMKTSTMRTSTRFKQLN